MQTGKVAAPRPLQNSRENIQGSPRVRLATGYPLFKGRSYFLSNFVTPPSFALFAASYESHFTASEMFQKSLNARETASARTTHSEVNSDLPEREIREFRQKPESPASQIVGRPGVNYRPYVSLSPFSAAKIQLSGGGYAQKRRRRQIAAHLPRERASLRTRNNALVARRVIKNHAYAVHTITILPSFPKATPPSTLRQCSSILAWLQ